VILIYIAPEIGESSPLPHGSDRTVARLALWFSTGFPQVKPSINTYSQRNIMSIRKAIAQQLSKASKALEEDQSKEKIGTLLMATRIGIANVIMPKVSTINS
jgi:hypothetical protein